MNKIVSSLVVELSNIVGLCCARILALGTCPHRNLTRIQIDLTSQWTRKDDGNEYGRVKTGRSEPLGLWAEANVLAVILG